MKLILPKESQKIYDQKLLQAYLTECLVKELKRLKTHKLKDFVQDLKSFNFETKEKLMDMVRLTDEFELKLK